MNSEKENALDLIIRKRRAWVEMGLDIGEIILLGDKFRGIGKSAMIAEKAIQIGATVICSNESKAKLLKDMHPELAEAIGSSEFSLRGRRGLFVIDDLTESEYERVKINLPEQPILFGVIRKDGIVNECPPKKEISVADTSKEGLSLSVNFGELASLSEDDFAMGLGRFKFLCNQ